MYPYTKHDVILLNSDEDTDPEGLLCDEGEVGYWPLLLAPAIRNAGVSQNLPVFEPHAHIQSDVPTAARQTDVKTAPEREQEHSTWS